MKLVYHTIFPFGFLFLFIIIFFLRLFYPESSLFMIPDFGESDVIHLNLPLKTILSQSLKAGKWPLWTPLIGNGFPILAEGQIGTFYIPNLFLFRFFDPVFAYNSNLVLSFVVAALGMYLLARKIGCSQVVATYSSFLFTFSGFLSVHLNHFNLIQASAFAPLILWGSLCLWQKVTLRYIILFTFLLSQQLFTGHFYIVFITLVGVFLLFILLFFIHVYSHKDKKRYSLFRFLALIASILFAIGLSSIQLVPTLELWRNSVRKGGLDFDTVTSFAFPYKHILTFFSPYALGSPADGSYKAITSEWIIFWENIGYIGLLPILLAIISIFFFRKPLVKIFVILTLLSFLLVLGRNSPLYFVFSLPLFNLFRVPSKFLLLTTLSLSILSGITFETVIKRIPMLLRNKLAVRSSIIICILFTFGSSLADLFSFSYFYPPISPAKSWLEVPSSFNTVSNTRNRILTIAAPAAWNDIFLKKGWKDISPFVYFKNSLYPNYNSLFNLKQADYNTGGIVPSRLAYMVNFIKTIDISEKEKIASLSAQTYNIASLMSVEYLISAFPIFNVPLTSVTTIFPPSHGLNPFYIYRNNTARTRAYIAYNTDFVKTVEEFNQLLSQMDYIDKNSIIIEDEALQIANPAKEINQAKIVTETDSEIVIEAVSSTPSILILTDTYYPGWKAFIDNKYTQIYQVNIFQKGILLSEGPHVIKFIYQPVSFELGKYITLLTSVIIFVAVFLFRGTFPQTVFGSKKPY